MKNAYRIVTELKSKSGFVWDDVTGMSAMSGDNEELMALINVSDLLSSLSTTYDLIVIRVIKTSSSTSAMAGHIVRSWIN